MVADRGAVLGLGLRPWTTCCRVAVMRRQPSLRRRPAHCPIGLSKAVKRKAEETQKNFGVPSQNHRLMAGHDCSHQET